MFALRFRLYPTVFQIRPAEFRNKVNISHALLSQQIDQQFEIEGLYVISTTFFFNGRLFITVA